MQFRFLQNLINISRQQKNFFSSFLKNQPTIPMDKVISVENPEAVTIAAHFLAASEVIALPTDTVYGVACNANDPHAIQEVYRIKGRNELKPVAICVADISALKHYGLASHVPDELLMRLLPGPVTLVLQKSPNLDNPFLNPGISKIGIRIPDYKFIQDVCRACDFPVALTSANRSSEKSTLHVDEFKGMWMHLGKVFDGGQLGLTEAQRAASTVIDLATPGQFEIIREGVAAKSSILLLETYGFKENI